MKKLMICMAMLSGMAIAQTGTGTSAGTSTDTSTKPAHKHAAKAKADNMANDADNKSGAKEKTVTGCLHKDGENIWLQTRTTKYHVMSKEDLSAHDGHEMKLTGTALKAPAPNDTSGKKINHLEASKAEMVSDKCKMGTKSMKMNDDEMSKKGKAKKS